MPRLCVLPCCQWLGGHKLQVQLVAEDGTHLVTKPCDMAGDFLAAAFADDDSMHELVLDKSASRGEAGRDIMGGSWCSAIGLDWFANHPCHVVSLAACQRQA